VTRAASRDLEIAKSTFAGEEACEACRLNKAAERNMTPDGFAMLGPDGGQYPVPITLSLSLCDATKLAR
jgi:hypothetical protein